MSKLQEAKIYQRIWKTGANTDVITIKKDIMKLLDAKRGDVLQAVITKIENEATKATEDKTGEIRGKKRLFGRRE